LPRKFISFSFHDFAAALPFFRSTLIQGKIIHTADPTLDVVEVEKGPKRAALDARVAATQAEETAKAAWAESEKARKNAVALGQQDSLIAQQRGCGSCLQGWSKMARKFLA